MSAQLEQPSSSPERSSERQISYTPPLHEPVELASVAAKTEQSPVKVQDDKIVMPPIAVNGWQGDSTASSTGPPPFLSLSNPYQEWSLNIASGRRVTTDTAANTQTDRQERWSPYDIAAVGDARSRQWQPLGANDRHNKNIVDAARGLVDQKVWQGGRFESLTQNGRLGGAASVSRILQGLGYDYANSPGVSDLTNKLLANGWQLTGLTQAKPGDIIFGGKTGTDWRAGGGNARIGIVGEDGKVYYNNPETGKWTQSTLQEAFQRNVFGDQLWVVRPPAEGPQAARHYRRDEAGDPGAGRHRRGHRYDFDPGDRGRNYDYGDQYRQGRQDRYGSRNGYRGRGQRDYTDYRGRQGWDGMNDGQYPSQQADAGGFNPFNILRHAIEGIGQALWSMTPFRNVVRGGRLGCAASVSAVLQRAGYRYANHAGVGGLESQLMKNGWRKAPLSEAAPGDVVMIGRSRGWRAGGGSAHVGIVGENGSVYHNSSSRAHWIKDDLRRRFGGGIERFVLKPPPGQGNRFDPRMFEVNPEPTAHGSRHFRDQHPRSYGRQDYHYGQPDYGDQRRGRQHGADYDRGRDRRWQHQYDQQRPNYYNQDPMSQFANQWERVRDRDDDGDRRRFRAREQRDRRAAEQNRRIREQRQRRRRG